MNRRSFLSLGVLLLVPEPERIYSFPSTKWLALVKPKNSPVVHGFKVYGFKELCITFKGIVLNEGSMRSDLVWVYPGNSL